MDERDDVPLTVEHAQTWMLLLLRAGAVAGFNPMPSEIFHRLVFLSNARCARLRSSATHRVCV